jgi:threonylcarbamoyladenosine tRNA methylthiotransferase MtaB
MDTFNFIEKLDISYLHVFTYSERDNTDAIEHENTVDKKIRADRSSKLRRLSEHKLSNFYDKHIGTSRPVLFDTKKGNQIFGYTDNYIKVAAETSSFDINTVHKIDLLSNERARVFGSPTIQA